MTELLYSFFSCLPYVFPTLQSHFATWQAPLGLYAIAPLALLSPSSHPALVCAHETPFPQGSAKASTAYPPILAAILLVATAALETVCFANAKQGYMQVPR